MTSTNGNIFRVTGPFCGEFTGHQWIPLPKASDAELWCFHGSVPQQTFVETTVIWDTITLIMTSLQCNQLCWLLTSCTLIDILSRWRHQMETFSALLALCAGNSPVTGEFPTQWPVARSFDVSFDLRLNKPLSKQSWGWWLETPSHPLWRHGNDRVKNRFFKNTSVGDGYDFIWYHAPFTKYLKCDAETSCKF